MASHKHSRGTSFVTFGTAGLGEEFIGTKEDRARSPTGTAVVDMADLLFSQTASTDCILFVHIDWVLHFISLVIFSQFSIQPVKFATKTIQF
jgi:hypothetical protein